MDTLAEARNRMAECPLVRAVTVTDTTEDGRPRRMFAFQNADSSRTEVNIDRTPSDRQRRDLAAHLPVLERDRDAVISIVTRA